MKLLSLLVDNFKSLRNFEFVPDGHDADIYGDNATGKTTVADAYFWLLFGKNFAGKSDFDILPMDQDGHILDGLEASVTGSFSGEDGKTFKLRRAYHQVFTRKNGEAERKLKGNTTDFYIDDVPKPQKDYQAFVAGICDERTFAMLTDPDMFPGKIGWDERRDMLIRCYAGDVSDREIINAHDELKPLGSYIGYKTVDDYAEMAKAQRKAINDELRGIPGRIDEAEKAKPAEMPLAGDGLEMLRLQREKIKLESDIAKLHSGESAAAVRKQIAELEEKTAKASAEYSRRTAAGNGPMETRIARIRADIAAAENERSESEGKIRHDTGEISRLVADMDKLRQQCIDKAAEEFNPENHVCPTCGQDYPPEKMEELRTEFYNTRGLQLDQLESRGKSEKSECDRLNAELVDAQEKQKAAEVSLTELRAELDAALKEITHPTPFEGTDEFAALKEKLDAAHQELQVIDTSAAKREAEYQKKLDTVSADLNVIKKRALNQDIVARQDARIAELKKREQQLGQELAIHEKGIQLAERFTQLKAQDIEKKVNGAFRIVRWKLFDTQVNGGVKPCCEATVDGIPYGKDLNSAAKLNAGLDIINALADQFGFSAPIWIDNAESVTRFLPCDAQIIRLHVSENDKKLRSEVRE